MAGESSLPISSTLSRVMPLWRLAFRPFFLFGALFSLLAMLAWGAFWHGSLLFEPLGGMVWWHQHEMLFGFVAAIVAGFLLTAVQNWTGQRSLHGWPLLAIVLVWLAGRLVMAFPGLMSPPGAPNGLSVALVDLAFLPLVAGVMARLVIRAKQWRNLIFVPVLVLLVVANALMHWGLARGDGTLVRAGAHLAVLLITLLMVVLGGRVIPFFTSLRLKRPKAQPGAWLERLAIGGVAALVLIGLLGAAGLVMPALLTAALAISAGLANLWRLARWEGGRTLREPLLWGLHASYAFVGLGLVMFGLAALGDRGRHGHHDPVDAVAGLAGAYRPPHQDPAGDRCGLGHDAACGHAAGAGADAMAPGHPLDAEPEHPAVVPRLCGLPDALRLAAAVIAARRWGRLRGSG